MRTGFYSKRDTVTIDMKNSDKKLAELLGWSIDYLSPILQKTKEHGLAESTYGKVLVAFIHKDLRVLVDNGGSFIFSREVSSRKDGRDLVDKLTSGDVLTRDFMKSLGFEYLL